MPFEREAENPGSETGRFLQNQISTSFGNVEPQMKAYAFGDVRGIFPQVLAESIEEGMRQFEHKITGFSDGDTLLSGVESRTSSPVKFQEMRIWRVRSRGFSHAEKAQDLQEESPRLHGWNESGRGGAEKI